jgi:solute:Na+ symporter, SSS family
VGPSPTGIAGYVVFGLYLLIMVVIGVASGRQQQSAGDLWVAGRRFGTAVLVMGLMAAIMHGGSILSGVAFAGAFGGVAILPFMSFSLGFLVILLFLAKKLRDSRAYTLPDYMGDRFDSRPLRAFSAFVVAASSVVYLIAQIRGMGLILEGLLGFPFRTSMVIGTALFVFYVAMGGMLAVIWTNVFQFLFMWLGLIILMPGVYHAAGGWSAVLERANAVAPGWTSVLGTRWTWGYLLSWWLVWFVAYATRIELITKVFIARDSKVARYALPTTCLLVILFLLYGNLYLGAAARILVWDGLRSPDQALPALSNLVLGPTAAAIALTGIASAAMSTTDSLLLLSGAAVAHDLLRRSYHEPRGVEKSDAYYLRVSRLVIVAVGFLSFLGALTTPALLLAIVSYAVAMIGAAFFFPMVLGLAWPRTTPAAALASSVLGFLTTVAWIALTLRKVPWAVGLHPIVPGLAVALALILGLTPFTRSAPASAVARFFPPPAPGAGA